MDSNKMRRLALLNAVEHGGRAEANSVLGKMIAEDPSVKQRVKEIIGEIKKTVDEVNSLGLEYQKRLVGDRAEKRERREEVPSLPDLPNTERGKVVTAFPPEPSKYPHLGHAKSALINFVYARDNKGKFVLRFEDSNPDLAKKEYYGALLDGLKWLGIKWDVLDYLSDHLPKYYMVIESLIKKGEAYVCMCGQEKVKHLRSEGKGCEHREASVQTNMEMWKKMLAKMKPGEATVRIAIDMASPNTTLRDPAIARIVDKPHPRTKKKFRVWPNYDLGTSMLDAWEGVTHRVRTKEFELRKDLQDHILKSLGFKPPYITEIGRFEVKDAVTKGREIRDGIKAKLFSGWDDPRLATLAALRRRGFSPDALKEFLLSTGATKTESVYEWQTIESFNRKAIDPVSDRYFGVLEPVRIKLEGLPKIGKIAVQTRPGSKKRRAIPVKSDTVYIEKEDEVSMRGRNAGLMFLCTASMAEVKRFVSREVSQETQKIHWVGEPNVKIRVLMPDGSVKSGLGEPALKKAKVGRTVQLYRVGFCRVDKTGKETVLCFAHK